jgi:hypothetical protein
MQEIPTATFQILGPNEGAAEGSVQGLWFKVYGLRFNRILRHQRILLSV